MSDPFADVHVGDRIRVTDVWPSGAVFTYEGAVTEIDRRTIWFSKDHGISRVRAAGGLLDVFPTTTVEILARTPRFQPEASLTPVQRPTLTEDEIAGIISERTNGATSFGVCLDAARAIRAALDGERK